MSLDAISEELSQKHHGFITREIHRLQVESPLTIELGARKKLHIYGKLFQKNQTTRLDEEIGEIILSNQSDVNFGPKTQKLVGYYPTATIQFINKTGTSYLLPETIAGIPLVFDQEEHGYARDEDTVLIHSLRTIYDLAALLHEYGHGFTQEPQQVLRKSFVFDSVYSGKYRFCLNQMMLKLMLQKSYPDVIKGIDSLEELIFNESDYYDIEKDEESASNPVLERMRDVIEFLKLDSKDDCLRDVQYFLGLSLASHKKFWGSFIGVNIWQLQERVLQRSE